MTNITVQRIIRQVGGAILIMSFFSCNNNRNAPDVSDIKMDIQIRRFDRDFFSEDTLQLAQSLEQLKRKYPDFLPLYCEFLSPINAMVKQQGKTYQDAVLQYLRAIRPLYESVEKKYGSLKGVESGLEKSFRYVHYYYPSYPVPAVIASVESFNPDDPQEVYGTTLYHDTLILSLQMFLGKDFAGYDPVQYPDYLRRRFNEAYIVPNSIRTIASDIYPDTSESASLIEEMIEKGKQWFLMDKFLPGVPDSLKTGFSASQTEFVRKNEGNIWAEFLKDTPDPFTLDRERFKNYLGEAPFTQDMPHDLEGNGTPGNIGQWIGWQIVKKFAAKEPKKTVQDILATPARQIFQEANYKPK